MEKTIFKFKGLIKAHGKEKKISIIVIANKRSEAILAAKNTFKKMCEGLCEHAEYKILKGKVISVHAIVEVEKAAVKEEVSNN